MSKEYLEPEIEIIRLAAQDIIMVSGGGLEEDELPPIPIPNG